MKKFILFIIVVFIFAFSQNCFSFKKDSHILITENAIENESEFSLNNFFIDFLGFQLGTLQPLGIKFDLKNLIISDKPAQDFFLDGAFKEDEGIRWKNHFNDPLLSHT